MSPLVRNTVQDPNRKYCENCGTLIAVEDEKVATAVGVSTHGDTDHIVACSEECFEKILTGRGRRDR